MITSVLTGQGELFPSTGPSTVCQYCEHARRRVAQLAPNLTEQHCLQLMGEIALLQLTIDRLERHAQLLASFPRQAPERHGQLLEQLAPPAPRPTPSLEPRFADDRPAWAIRRRSIA